jgi:hypothetical protein
MKIPFESMVPSEICLQCDICCRFPEADSVMAPVFTRDEVSRITLSGAGPEFLFSGGSSGRIRLMPFPKEVESPGHQEGCICPAFDPLSHRCKIYPLRPLDCRLYPFLIMKSEEGDEPVLGIDTQCPYVRDPKNSDRIESCSRDLLERLGTDSYQKILGNCPELAVPFQKEARIIGPIRIRTR